MTSKSRLTIPAWSRTAAIHGGQRRSPFDETSEALYLTSGYVYPRAEDAQAAFAGDMDRYIYSRFGNPTVAMFEDKMAQLEGAQDCWATATGMAAVFATLMCQLKSGNRVVAARALFGSCAYILTEILPKFGVTVVLIDGTDLDAWHQALSHPTTLVFFETPANPTLELVDIEAVSTLAHKAGAKVIVDNVFASPFLQKPLHHGADIVVYSATKHIDGQGRCLGGAVLGQRDFCQEVLKPFIRNTGPSLSPFNAWVLTKSLETLDLRMTAACRSAERLFDFLSDRPEITRVLYPTQGGQKDLADKQMLAGGNVLTFFLKSSPHQEKSAAFAFLNRLDIIAISNNLGDTRSLITHPATTTHHRLGAKRRLELGITDGMVRLSVGLEDVEDLERDLAQALAG